MSYFRERHKINVEYSGNEELSAQLRERLVAVINRYSSDSNSYGSWVNYPSLQHEVFMHCGGREVFNLIGTKSYDYVFEIVEIFLTIAREQAYKNYQSVKDEIEKAFELSGSVYGIKNGQVELKIDSKTAENIEEAKKALKDNPSALEKFYDTVGKVMSRKTSSDDAIKNIFVAFEDYLKTLTSSKDFSKSIEKLLFLNSSQKALLHKIKAYRDDSYGVAHAGNSEPPSELEVIWYIDLVAVQMIYIDKKSKVGK